MISNGKGITSTEDGNLYREEILKFNLNRQVWIDEGIIGWWERLDMR